MVFDERSHEREILDDFALGGAELTGALKSIERVNRWLGGYRVLCDGVAHALSALQLTGGGREVVVHDLGCGGGDCLRELARWGSSRGHHLRLVGLDANPAVLELARRATRDHANVTLRQADILDPNLALRDVDVVTLNLCLHHFRDDAIEALLVRCREAGVRAVLVNDLHRHWLAWALFHLVCRVCFVPRIARVDGLLSVRKAFRRAELERLACTTGWRIDTLRWRWAFRYQLVLVAPGRG